MQTATQPAPKVHKGLFVPEAIKAAKMKANSKAPAKKSVQSVALKGSTIPNRYNFDAIPDAAFRAKIITITDDIRSLLRVHKDSRFNIGLKLNEAKSDKQWGDFEKWVSVEFPEIDKRTSKNYMALAREFTDTYPLVSYLPSQVLYALASGKKLDKVRAKVLAAAKSDNPLAKEAVIKLMAKGTGTTKAAVASKDVVTADAKTVQPTDDLQEVELRRQRTRDAVAMLTEALADNFPKFVNLIDGINFMEFKDALHHARSKFSTEAA